MPRLVGLSSEWQGMWSYTFDLIRSGIYPPQGDFKDPWMVADLVVYREPYSWDGPATVHSFCHWDASLAARTLHAYLAGATQKDGSLTVSANPYRAYPNATPQLVNNTMALWDCYEITRDPSVLKDCYPLLVRHVRWLETKRNRTPHGPLMDIGYNIDYGPPPEYYTQPTIWPDVQFFLVDHYELWGRIAQLIGRPASEAAEWSAKAQRPAEAIREHMWSETAGTFWCVSDKLEFKPLDSPIEFHSMTTGVASREQAERLLTRLKDPKKYAPSPDYPFGIPSAPFDSKLFVIKDDWSGTIWPIQTYHTVRGLVRYGYQDEAAAFARNLFWMMARDYRRTGTIWEQFDPRTGKDLNSIPNAGREGHADVGRGHFISGIATSVLDAAIRGMLGFERTDDPLTFGLAPRPFTTGWHGIDNLPLSGSIRVSILIKDQAERLDCKVRFTGLEAGQRTVAIKRLEIDNDTGVPVQVLSLDTQQEVRVTLDKLNGSRYTFGLQ